MPPRHGRSCSCSVGLCLCWRHDKEQLLSPMPALPALVTRRTARPATCRCQLGRRAQSLVLLLSRSRFCAAVSDGRSCSSPCGYCPPSPLSLIPTSPLPSTTRVNPFRAVVPCCRRRWGQVSPRRAIAYQSSKLLLVPSRLRLGCSRPRSPAPWRHLPRHRHRHSHPRGPAALPAPPRSPWSCGGRVPTRRVCTRAIGAPWTFLATRTGSNTWPAGRTSSAALCLLGDLRLPQAAPTAAASARCATLSAARRSCCCRTSRAPPI